MKLDTRPRRLLAGAALAGAVLVGAACAPPTGAPPQTCSISGHWDANGTLDRVDHGCTADTPPATAASEPSIPYNYPPVDGFEATQIPAGCRDAMNYLGDAGSTWINLADQQIDAAEHGAFLDPDAEIASALAGLRNRADALGISDCDTLPLP